MNSAILIAGLAFLGLGIYAFFEAPLVVSILPLAIGTGLIIYAVLIPSERQIARKVHNSIVTGVLELGDKKIKNGTLRVDPEKFHKIVETLGPLLSVQMSMPEIGFDSIYMHFHKENDADAMLEKVKSLSISASVVQNKGDWSVKIEIA